MTHWKRPWCWETLKVGGEGDDRGWDGWKASPTQWTWIWVNSRSWWQTGRPGMLQSMELQRVRHKWETELNWLHGWLLNWCIMSVSIGSAMREENISCLLLQLLHQSERINMSAVLPLESTSHLVARALPPLGSVNSVSYMNGEKTGVTNKISKTVHHKGATAEITYWKDCSKHLKRESWMYSAIIRIVAF